jgi:hypothetical protein
VSLSADLLALAALLNPEHLQEWGDPDSPGKLCPRLRTTYSPRVTWRGFAPDPKELEKAPSQREWARLWAPPDPAELGSSLAPNPKRPTRYGLNGMTGPGRRSVWRALALLEERRPLLAFWTVTLGPREIRKMAEADAVATFQDRLRKELVRLLGLKGLRPEVVGVVEIQPRRARQTGFPVPHWHVVFVGRQSRYHRWALSKADLDGVIGRALATVGIHNPDLRAAGNVQQVKRSVRAYLATYMTKKAVDPSPYVATRLEAFLPRQWWFWSRELRTLVLAHILPLCFQFLNWVHCHREAIQARELAQFRLLDLPDPRAPATWEVNWGSCANVAQLVAAWQLDLWDADWATSERIRKWQP